MPTSSGDWSPMKRVLRPDEVVVSWSTLKRILDGSSLITIVFGGFLVFGLSEALLADAPSCNLARAELIDLGQRFLFAVGALAVSAIALNIGAPPIIRLYSHSREYLANRTLGEMKALSDAWLAADVDRPLARLTVIALALFAILLVFLTLMKAFDFLEASRACTPYEPPPQVHQGTPPSALPETLENPPGC